MSKIIINEIDNTARAIGEYQNFSVVVPGFIAEGKTGEGFDDNGILELNKISDFKQYIGIVQATPAALEGTKPELTVVSDPEEPIQDYGTLTPDQMVYYKQHKCEIYNVTEFDNATTEYLEGENGYLQGFYKMNGGDVEKFYKFTLVEILDPNTRYVVIAKGKEGISNQEYTNLGNQIAREVIGLGYTVLYKKLNILPTEELPNPTIADALAQMDTAEFWSCLKDKSTYDFRYITTGGYTSTMAYEQIAKVATYRKGDDSLEPETPDSGNIEDAPGRGDCSALIDLPETDPEFNLQNVKASQSALIKEIRKLGNARFSSDTFNEYSKFFIPNVVYKMNDNTYENKTFPGSFHYLACAARAARTVREWFAVAGYDNGISDYSIEGTTLTLGDLATTALQPRRGYTSNNEIVFNKAINVITKIRGNYYLWGNRTAHTIKESGLIASDFANIRELCSSLKKVIWVACRQLTFSPNSDLLWINFCNKVRPLLDAMKANEGIKDYAFVKVPTDKKAVMLGKIRIVPIEAVEDFELDLYLENSIEGQVVEVEEN